MPVFECYDYCPKARIARRKAIERDLVNKGLDRRSLKFQSVLHRKLRRR
jgi:hypothetical protein